MGLRWLQHEWSLPMTSHHSIFIFSGFTVAAAAGFGAAVGCSAAGGFGLGPVGELAFIGAARRGFAPTGVLRWGPAALEARTANGGAGATTVALGGASATLTSGGGAARAAAL